MSGKLMAQIYGLKLTPAKREILMAMAENAADDGSNCKPGVPLIAWKVDLSERQVQRIQKALIADKLLIVVDTPVRKPVVYKINLSAGALKSAFVSRDKHKGVNMSPIAQCDGDILSQSEGDNMSANNLRVTSHGKDETAKGDIGTGKTASIPLKEEPIQKKERTRARPKPEYGFSVDFKAVEGVAGSVAFEDGELIPTPKRGEVAQTAIAIFTAYLGVLRELGRAPIGGDEQLWHKHHDFALRLALARETPETVERYMVEQYRGGDNFWPSRQQSMTLRHVAENIRAARASKSPSTTAPPKQRPAHTAPDELRDQYLSGQMRKAGSHVQ